MATELRLPEFERPPVVETVLSVRFRETAGLTTASIVQFWESELVSDFPEVAEQAPYSALIEHLGQDAPSGGFPIQLETGFPSPRFWFKGGAELVQLQPDWFAYNWRRPPGLEAQYTRYPSGRENFSRHLKSFCEHLRAETGFTPTFNQCEITYVNTIVPSGIWTEHSELERVTPLWRSIPPHGENETVERARLDIVVAIHDQGTQVGRLHVGFSPSTDATGNPTFLMNLTARGRPLGDGVEGVLAFLDLGRGSVVRNFVRFTTPELHQVWGKT